MVQTFLFNKKNFFLVLKIVVFLFIIWRIIDDNPAAVKKGYATRIDQINPALKFPYLIRFSKGEDVFKLLEFEGFKKYYTLVTEGFPLMAEAYGLLGYSSYYLSDEKSAVKAYRQAVSLASENFWFYYNLALIYLRQGDTVNAEDVLVKGLTIEPDATIQFLMSSSHIYWPIFNLRLCESGGCRKEKDLLVVVNKLQGELFQGYKQAHELLLLAKGVNAKRISVEQMQDSIGTFRLTLY